jgi:cytochrome c oxidase assembly factor CtaG
MAGALVAGVVATQGPVAGWEDDKLTGHMVQHVLLGMVVPLLAVLAAPLTLALQTARPGTRRLLRRSLHSRAARVLTHPLVGWCLFGGSLALLYLTPLLDAAARWPLLHVAIHTHIVLVGILFLAPLVGIDPLPTRPPFAARLLALLAAVPFHAVVALALLSARSPVAPETYPSLSDQRTAAALFWGTGEIFTLIAAGIVFRQWWVAEQRAERRELGPVATPALGLQQRPEGG